MDRDEYGRFVKGHSFRMKQIDYEVLKRLYVTEKRTMLAIGKHFGFTSGTPIKKRLESLNIPLRKWRFKDGKLRELLPEEKAWLACAIDSEGSIIIRKVHGKCQYPEILVYNTDVEFLNHFAKIVGTKSRPCKLYKSRTSFSKKTTFCLKINRVYLVKNILNQILPFLIIKKDKAKEVLGIIDEFY